MNGSWLIQWRILLNGRKSVSRLVFTKPNPSGGYASWHFTVPFIFFFFFFVQSLDLLTPPIHTDIVKGQAL